MTPEPFDFYRPARLPAAVRASLAGWLAQAATRMSRSWSAQLPFAAEVLPGTVDVLSARALAEQLPETAVRFLSARSGSADLSLLAVSRPLLVAILGGVLGEPLEANGLDRPLTAIEACLADVLAAGWFLQPLAQAWSLPQKLQLEQPRSEAGSTGLPWEPAAPLLVARFHVRAPLGEWDWWWALPRAGWFDSLVGSELLAPSPSREERRALVWDLPLELTVQLGNTALPLLHLAALKVGDVLLLDQPITRPLPVCVGGQVKFLVWPGARGTRQAVAIHGPVES